MKNLWRNHGYAILLMCLVMLTCAMLAINTEDDYEKTYISITVHEGETLWDLSKRYVNEHGMNEMDFVAWVEKTNHIDGDSIKAGESLLIPVKISKLQSTELASN